MAANRVAEGLAADGSSDLTVIDGGPHALWWSTQRHDGVDSGMVPVPQLHFAMVPEARLIVSLAEPARRMYSDYWFLTAKGVAGRRGTPKEHQNADDFHTKALADVHAMDLCFDRRAGGASPEKPEFKWPLAATQFCAYDMTHFAKNGRGRMAVSVYAPFVARWLDASDGPGSSRRVFSF